MKHIQIEMPEKPTKLQIAQLQTEVKRINTRLQSVAKEFGTESETYKNIVSSLKASEFSGVVYESKSGVTQLTTRAKAYTTKEATHALNIGRKVKTFSQITEGKTGTKREKIEQVETESRIANEFQQAYNNYATTHTDSEIEEIAPQLFKSFKTYAELDKAKYDMNSQIKKENEQTNKKDSPL